MILRKVSRSSAQHLQQKQHFDFNELRILRRVDLRIANESILLRIWRSVDDGSQKHPLSGTHLSDQAFIAKYASVFPKPSNPPNKSLAGLQFCL